MPPEPLSWDRKDFFKERKHERSESLGSAGRWRDSSSHHGQREFNRWGSAEFRRHPGHGKQGGWHMFSEDYGHGYTPSRPCDKMLEDDTCRPSFSRGEGKYGRNSREIRGSFSQRDWKGHSWEINNGSLNAPGRLHEVNNDQRSVDDTPAYPSHSQLDFGNSCDQLPSNDNHEKIEGVNGSGTSQRYDKESPLGSLEWKTLKWARSGSLSSRGSGFSHSSSSKSMGGVDSNETNVKPQPKNVTPVQSPSGDAATFVTSAPSEETVSRKKPRLKWGEGLAKYEKKKVDGPDEGLNRNVVVFSASNSEPVLGNGSNLSDRSPRVTAFSDCASPATPSSVACSSSPGLEDKSFVKAVNIDDVTNLCMSPGQGVQGHLERFPFNLEKLDISLIANLGSSVTQLLQSDDPSLDSSFVRSTAMSKLLVWKGDLSKTLEITETEIDMLENELKLLKSESSGSGARPAASSSLQVENNTKASQEQGVLIHRPAPLHIISCGDTTMEEMALCNGALDAHADVKDEDIDSPGTATSKFVEQPALGTAAAPSVAAGNGECAGNLIEDRANSGANLLVSCSSKKTGAPTCEDGNVFNIQNDEPVSKDPSLHADGENMLYKVILASNKVCADQASEVFNKLMPSSQYKFDKSEVNSTSICQNESLIREKFATRKHFLRFKERAITLKFKALRHLWKEDLHVLSLKKYRAKSQRKFESSLRVAHSGCQKHRSSVRPRFSSTGNLSVVPTAEIITYTSKMHLDSPAKPYRNTLKMPALILDKKEKMVSRFINSNGLVEDPCAIEKERTMINPWTSEEKEIFMDKLAIFGKDFKKIASFLEHKTTADCVEFYYKNHKSDCFEKTKKKGDVRKQEKSSTSTYMLTSGKKWNREMNVASLDMLGAVSVMAANADRNMLNRHTGRFYLGNYSGSKISQADDGIIERTSSVDLGNERETAAADVLAGICGSVSSEAMGSCITSSVDPGEGHCNWKYRKVGSSIKRPLMLDVTQNVDDETCSDESCGEMDPVDWTDEEKSIFIQAVSSYGKDFLKISRCVRTRSRDQCKVFFSKARKCLGLDSIRPRHANVGTPRSDDANGGGSDAEDACLVETGSVVCSDKSGSKMDEDLPSSVIVANHVEPDLAETAKKINQTCFEAVVSSTPKDCEMEDRPGSVSDGDKGVIDVSGLVQAPKSAATLTNAGAGEQVTEQGVSISQSVTGPSSSNAVLDETIGVSEISIGGSLNGLEGRALLFSGCSLDNSRDENCNSGSSGRDSGLQCSTRDSNTVTNASHLAAEASSCSGLSLDSENAHLSSLPSKSVEKALVISLHQEKSLAIANSLLNQDRLSSTHDSESRDKQCHKSVRRDDFQQNPLQNHVESSSILRGYPLEMPCKKEMSGDVSCVQLPEVQGLPKSDERIFSSRFLRQDCYLQKCSTSSPHPVAELPLLPQSLEQISDYQKSHSRSLSDTEKPSRNGDVKLFGTILTTPSSQQSNPVTHQQENEEKPVSHHPKMSIKALSLKSNGHTSMDGNSALLKFDSNNYLGLENIPMRSYGFWDGNKIQTGFSSLPDSAILLAKYPAIFSNYPTSSKMEQQPMQAVVRSNECSLNGVSVFPTREISSSSSNAVVDYQVYRTLEGSNVQQQPQMQIRNGLEPISSLQQQQARSMVGVNGVLVGGPIPCTGVSDPVAAIKMHYAKTDQYGQGGGCITSREDELWRGKGGDIGR